MANGSDLDIGGAILNVFGMQSERQRREEQAKFFADLQAAGSRERALDVVKNYSGKFQNPRDFTTAFGAVDEFYPESSKEIKQVTVYDEETGDPTAAFVRSGEVEQLSDPMKVKQRFGPRATLTKPDLETFYSEPDEAGKVKVLGKMPISKRPEGSVTLPELTAARAARAEELREERFTVSQEQFRERMDLAEDRWAAALAKLGESATDKSLQQGRSLLNDATRLTALSLNARMLPDGSFSFDDDNRTKLFNDRLRFMEELIQTDPRVLKRPTGGLELHTKASKALPLASETKETEPVKPPAKKEPGLISRLFGGRGEEPAAKPAAKADPAAQVKAKATEINARTDLTPEQKKAALDRLRAIAKQNKLKVEF